jgi:SNF2 family DNA or RNA helicase
MATNLDPTDAKTYEKLKQIRTRTDLKIRPIRFLRERFVGEDQVERDFRVRYYQIQGILHLIAMKRFVLGDDTGLGKTIETIVALSYLWEKTPNMKVVILTVKSTVPQWAAEFRRFTKGVNVFVNVGTPDKRIKIREAFVRAEGPTVCVMGYRTAVQDFAGDLQRWKNYVFVLDEASTIKNPTTQVHKTVAHMAKKADRVWGLTATLIENHLLEGWAVFQVVAPGLFTSSKTGFMKRFCITRMQPIGRGGRQIPIIVGYHEVGVKEFRDTMDPFYFGRAKWEVAEELPALTTRVIQVGMTKEQRAKYDEALEGLLLVGARDEEERAAFEGDVGEVETTKLTALIYCQEIVDHLALIGWDGPSDKLNTLLDMITEGDLSEQKVIIYTRFERMVTHLMGALEAKKVKAVRITGKESEKVRERHKLAFQNPKSGTNVIVINDAASRGVNLQAAKAIVFYDTPWSAGNYLQILGRMIRIGSIHDRVYALHLAAKDSIDERVLNVVGSKMELIEEIIGKRLKGDESLPKMKLEGVSALNELFAELLEDARKRRAS